MELWIIWLIAAAVLIVIEVATQMVWTICLAIGFVASAIAGIFGVGAAWQIAIAGIVSVIAYFALKPLFEKWQKKAYDKNRHIARTGMDALLGRRGTVTDEIKPGKMGRVRIDGDNWQFVSNDGTSIESGTQVRVTGYDSIILKVKPINK